MEKYIKLKRGLDLNLEGGISDDRAVPTDVRSALVAVTPDDFPGIVPRVTVREGDTVAEGDAIISSKRDERIKLCSPAAGTVEKIVRGERRKVMAVIIRTTGEAKRTFTIDRSDSGSVKTALLESGLWASMRQRPYDVVPDADAVPRDIFVTAFDSAPLAADMAAGLSSRQEQIDAGIAALSRLTHGNIYVSTRKDFPMSVPAPAIHVTIDGPHPAGNPGIQAANIAPVNKGETIWTLDIICVARIGHLLLTGTTDHTTLVAVTGSEVKTSKMVMTTDGAEIAPLLAGNVKEDDCHHRIISGNVLTGVTVAADGFLRFPYRQITVIPEGDDVDEFMGWASMKPSKLSVSRSFPLSRLRRSFSPDARLLGGHRAMIMSGIYDRMLPMDILPEYLLKAIISRDIDRMEQLGIYEVAPEDFALCEFADPSKTEIQRIVREGLDYMRKELE